MRDYALTRSHSIARAEGSGFVRLFRNWMARRAVLRLLEHDDHLLRDIGVTRDDVRWAAGVPLTMNAALALEERSFKRRRQPLID